MYDLIIIGGGPAAVSAGVYAGRKRLHTLVITNSFGGQSVVSNDIQNWIGTPSISGFELAQSLEKHLRAQPDIQIEEGEGVEKIEKKEDGTFVVSTKSKTFETKTVLIASGSGRKRLNVPGENEFEGRGVFYCSICDAPLFGEKTVAVVGGGNSALEAVIDLMKYASKIYLLHHGTELKGDPITQEKIKSLSKVEIIYQAETKEIKGDGMVSEIVFTDLKTNEERTIAVDGVFIEIGAVPNSMFASGLLEMNKYGAIVVDARTQATTCKGIWAAGDVTDIPYKQNNISVGDAAKAILNIYEFLHSR
ncbi:MAG: Glutaredoxin, GrxC family [Parcubacteria group bacterium LiPW_41]|nr:MAG: Glutaredoxin, GrxC family [Parcubacteria group bacterium LiPW_41]